MGVKEEDSIKNYYLLKINNRTKAYLEKISTLYIYCNLIKYQLVGNTEVPLLGVCPINGRDGEQVYWGFIPPYYIALNTKVIDCVEIKLTDEHGVLVPFDPSGKVVCRLHFRRKRAGW